MVSTQQTHYFPADGSRVKTELQPNGEYTAELDTGEQVGRGRTRLEAIADLVEQIESCC